MSELHDTTFLALYSMVYDASRTSTKGKGRFWSSEDVVAVALGCCCDVVVPTRATMV